MGAQLTECYAATAAQLPMRLSEVETRVQAVASSCADVVKVGGSGWGVGGGAQQVGGGGFAAALCATGGWGL